MVAKKIVCGLPNSQVFAFNCDADRLVRCVSGPAASARAAGSSGRVRPSPPRLPWGPPSLSIRRRYLCQPFPHGVRTGGHTCLFVLLLPMNARPEEAVTEPGLAPISAQLLPNLQYMISHYPKQLQVHCKNRRKNYGRQIVHFAVLTCRPHFYRQVVYRLTFPAYNSKREIL